MLALIFAIATLIAQDATQSPTPPPDPTVYDDPAMHYHAPPGYVALGQRQIPLTALSEDQPAIAAAWVLPNKDHPFKVMLQMEAFDGRQVADFESVLEEQLRDQLDSPLFKNKQHVALKNGMPAMLIELSSGSGFTLQKSFLLEWVDGRRGVALVWSGLVDDVTEARARAALLSDVSAVAYPTNEP
jgi:hypothetical protein